MAKFSKHFLATSLFIACILGPIIPAQAQNCFLTEAQVRDIKFHYDLDRYMVGGCIVGAVFSVITGVLTISGINMIAAVPYIATGCSSGFLVGGAGVAMYGMWNAQPTSTEKTLSNSLDKTSP